jgi:hypothetical protein
MDRVLTSWKEVANYMGRGVRTVQRWEHTLALPIQRPHAKRRFILFARPDELDAWMGFYGQRSSNLPASGQSGNGPSKKSVAASKPMHGGSSRNGSEAVKGASALGWTCARCKQPITRIEDGRVEWLAGQDRRGRTRLKGLRLVHRLSAANPNNNHGCRYDARHEFRRSRSIVEGLPLARFVGADGLMMMLSLIAEAELPVEEILELTKRVQIPGYEQARELLRAALRRGRITPAIAAGFYLQSEIRRVLAMQSRPEQGSRNAMGLGAHQVQEFASGRLSPEKGSKRWRAVQPLVLFESGKSQAA